MLRKLLKYDLKANLNVYLLMYAVLLVTALGTRLSFIDWISRFDEVSMIVSIIGSVLMLTYVIAVIAVNVICIVLIVRRFYTHLFGSEGYLSFTLPVTAEQHFFSKVISAVILYVVSILVQAISVLILTVGTFEPEVSNVVFEAFKEVFSGLIPVGDIIAQSVLSLFGMLSSLLLIYFSICVGQMVNRHRVISAVVIYFGANALLNVINTTITEAFMEVVSIGLDVRFDFNIAYYVFTGLLLVLQLVGFSFGSILIMKKKLNLE